MTRIEWLIMGAIGAIVLGIIFLVVAGVDLNNPRNLCLIKGGVPIVSKEGLLTSCDFPVNIGR